MLRVEPEVADDGEVKRSPSSGARRRAGGAAGAPRGRPASGGSSRSTVTVEQQVATVGMLRGSNSATAVEVYMFSDTPRRPPEA